MEMHQRSHKWERKDDSLQCHCAHTNNEGLWNDCEKPRHSQSLVDGCLWQVIKLNLYSLLVDRYFGNMTIFCKWI